MCWNRSSWREYIVERMGVKKEEMASIMEGMRAFSLSSWRWNSYELSAGGGLCRDVGGGYLCCDFEF